MGARILVAEDDAKQSALIRVYLEREGHAVDVVGDGAAALERARTFVPQLVVLDVMMPMLDGLAVCRVLRAESDVPILLLTARVGEDHLLTGLDSGADDYLTKPYSPRELVARVRALLRRSGGGGASTEATVTVGDLEVDPVRFRVLLAGESVEVTAKEFAILHTLAREPERVFTRTTIIDDALGADRDLLERTVDAHVMNLRRKLTEAGLNGLVPETVYGRGYRLGVPRVDPSPARNG